MSLLSTKSRKLPYKGKESTSTRDAMYFQTEHLLKDLHGRSFRGGVVTLGGQAVRFLLQTISTVALARLLRPQDFGLTAMVGAINRLDRSVDGLGPVQCYCPTLGDHARASVSALLD
jgi:hypothetical protein